MLNDAHKYHPLAWTRTRTHCVLLSNQDYQLKEIAKICGVCRQTVSLSIYGWEANGIFGLIDEHRSGRPSFLTMEQESELIEKVIESPRSLKRVIGEFSEKHGIEISIDLLKRLCKKTGFGWKRVRKSLKGKRNQEDFERSKEMINQLVESYKAGEINLRYFDESGFSLVSNVPYAWQKKGRKLKFLHQEA